MKGSGSSIVDRVFSITAGLVVGLLLLNWAIGLAWNLLASLWSRTIGQPLVEHNGGIGLTTLAILFLVGLLLRVGHGVRGFWFEVLRAYRGPRQERRRDRTRWGAEHERPDPSQNGHPRMRRRDSDPVLPLRRQRP